MDQVKQKTIAAKALRKSFNDAQSDLLRESYMSDEYLIERLREAQQQYKCFRLLVDEIKEEDEEVYKKEILGV